jgi:hypothetical protein
MLNWETVDLKAVYPTSRYVAFSGDREYRLFAQHDGWWHVVYLAGEGRVWQCGVNCRELDAAKGVAERWEDQVAA